MHPATYKVCSLIEEIAYVGEILWAQTQRQPIFMFPAAPSTDRVQWELPSGIGEAAVDPLNVFKNDESQPCHRKLLA